MSDIITQRLKLIDIHKDKAEKYGAMLGIKAEDVEFIRKGIMAEDVQFDEGEHAVITYINTRTIDRDREIVEPSGAMLDDYRKTPVVLWAHNYWDLPIGKNIWIKQDDKGLVAKTVYANHEFAQTVYNYRKDGFPLAESIGFIPVKWEDMSNSDPNVAEDLKGCRRRYTKWIMLEYSDVPVPSNPDAIMIAVSKGLIKPNYELIEEKAGRVLSSKNRTMIMAAVQQMDEASAALRELLTATEPDEPADEPNGGTVEMAASEQVEKVSDQVLDPVVEKQTITKIELIEALQGAIKQNRVSVAGIIDETIAKRLGRATLD